MKTIKITMASALLLGALIAPSSSLAVSETVTQKSNAQPAIHEDDYYYQFPDVIGWAKPSVDYLVKKKFYLVCQTVHLDLTLKSIELLPQLSWQKY